MTKPTDVDAYIEAASPAARPLLRQLRQIVLDSCPAASEKISYGMPSYDLGGRRLVYFAAAQNHIGVYGLVHEDGEVPDELVGHLDHRSTLRFQFDRPLPAAPLTATLLAKVESLQES